MTNTFEKIVRNSFFRAIVEGTKVISNFVLVILLARWLGPSEYGRMSYALAIMAFVSVGLNMGLPLIFVREGARREEFLKENISTGLILQAIAGVALLIILFLTIWIFPALRSDSLLLFLALIYTTFGVIVNFFFSVFQAVQKMNLEAFGVVVQGVLTIIFTSLFILVGTTAEMAMWGYATALILSAIYVGWLLKRKLFSWRWHFNLGEGRDLIRKSWPLMASLAFGGIYGSLDSVMLRFYQGNEIVGIYSAQYRVMLVFSIFAGWYIYSILPILSSSYIDNREQFKNLLSRSVQNMTAFALLFGLTVTFLSPQILFALYGDAYASGAIILRVSIWSTMVSLIGTVYYFSLIAASKQSQVMWGMAVGAALNVLFNIVLIPRFGMMGAAVSTIVAQSAQLIMNWHSLNQDVQTHLFTLMIKPIVLAIPIVIIYFVAKSFFNPGAVAVVVMFGYVIMLIRGHIFELQEIKQILPSLLGSR